MNALNNHAPASPALAVNTNIAPVQTAPLQTVPAAAIAEPIALVTRPAAPRASAPALHPDFRPLAIPALVAATRVMTGGSKTRPVGG